MPSFEPGNINVLGGVIGLAYGLVTGQTNPGANGVGYGLMGYLIGSFLQHEGGTVNFGKRKRRRIEPRDFDEGDDLEREREARERLARRRMLGYGGGGALYGPNYNPRPRRKRHRNPVGAERLYEDFHGAPPATERRVQLPEPRGPVMQVGRVIEIVYEPEKPSTLAGKQFQHEFGDRGLPWFDKNPKHRPILATDGKDLFIVRDKSKHYFSERGIIA